MGEDLSDLEKNLGEANKTSDKVNSGYIPSGFKCGVCGQTIYKDSLGRFVGSANSHYCSSRCRKEDDIAM